LIDFADLFSWNLLASWCDISLLSCLRGWIKRCSWILQEILSVNFDWLVEKIRNTHICCDLVHLNFLQIGMYLTNRTIVKNDIIVDFFGPILRIRSLAERSVLLYTFFFFTSRLILCNEQHKLLRLSLLFSRAQLTRSTRCRCGLLTLICGNGFNGGLKTFLIQGRCDCCSHLSIEVLIIIIVKLDLLSLGLSRFRLRRLWLILLRFFCFIASKEFTEET